MREAELRRTSIRYHLPKGSGSSEAENLDAELFARDAAEFLFPVDGRVQRQEIFRLSPRDEGVAMLVAAGFGGERPLSSALSSFAIRAAHRLVLRGRVTFEVAPLVDGSGRAVGFSVEPVESARSFAGVTWQHVPKDALVHTFGKAPAPVQRRRIRIPEDRVVHMMLPKKFKRLPADLRALADAERVIPEFVIRSLGDDGDNLPRHDPEEFGRVRARAIASTTRPYGWDGRGALHTSVTGYYTIRRFLRFEAFKAELRSTVVATINQILLKAGAVVGFGAAVSLHHVPTLGDVQVSRADLAAGKLDFQEAMEQYSVYRRQPDAAAS